MLDIFNNKLKLSKKWSIWYINSFDNSESKKQILDENKNKWQAEELVRQLYLIKLVEEYGYPREFIKCEVLVNFWREKKRADIVIYQNRELIIPRIIVEVKEPREKNNIEQLKSYLNAEGSPIWVWINGRDISIFLRPYPKDFEIIPDLPSFSEFEQVKNLREPIKAIRDIVLSRKWKHEDLVKYNKTQNFNLKTIIEDLEELVLANSWVDSFNEIFKLIYAKLYDEFEAENSWNWELKFKSYINPSITYKEISDLFEKAKNQWKDIFDNEENIKLKPEHLSICLPKLEKIKLFWNNLRIVDEAFEYLVPEASKSKKWQYFTPRIIIDTCVKILNPTNKEYILDPSCWSAGFLVHSMQYVWGKYDFTTYKQKTNYASKYLYGIDFDERSTKISKAIMLIVWDWRTHIFNENTLDYKKWSEKILVWLKDENLIDDTENKELKFDIILSNPPFAWDIQEKNLIAQYISLLWDKIYTKSIDRHILFIQRILDMLKPWWRTAIVLPQGVFNNTSDKYIRDYILDKARILWVVWLHWNSFKPHTWTKTSIFFLKKWEDEWQRQRYINDDYEIFMWVNKAPIKDNSWNYIFLKDENALDILAEKDEFPYNIGDLIYKNDLLDIADAFINWGKKRLNDWDEMFSFLE